MMWSDGSRNLHSVVQKPLNDWFSHLLFRMGPITSKLDTSGDIAMSFLQAVSNGARVERRLA